MHLPVMSKHSILVVDDEPELADGLRRMLAAEFPDLAVRAEIEPQQALARIKAEPVDMVFTDLKMPGMDGMELLARIKKIDPAVSVVVVSAFGSVQAAVEAVKHGAFDFICKPFDCEAICRLVPIALERSQLIRENISLKRRFSDRVNFANFVGQSEPMRRFYGYIQAVARTDYTVLVRGESGTGKELTAKAIHALSRRKEAPLVMINCPAIPEHLLESELFGHAKGAFTGAETSHAGLFEEADGGVICLDEIGDIPLSVQTKLLRVLQEGEIRRLGSGKTRKVDVRVVAATNQDLERKIAEGSFRSDLFYRLNVVTIWTPALKEIGEDLPLLANHFLKMACDEQNLTPRRLSGAALDCLARRPWPGNVRELQNVVRRAVLFSGEEVIGPEHFLSLGGPIAAASGPGAESRPEEGPPGLYRAAKESVVEQFSRQYFNRLLRTTRGNVSRAAELSGLTRAALQKIIRRYDLRLGDFRGL